MAEPSHPCPCCGFLVHDEPPGSYAICPICFWEDDALQLEFATTLAGGANPTTLLDAQRCYAQLGACEPGMLAHVRAAGPGDRRDPSWRPIDPRRDRFPAWGARDGEGARPDGEALYYWRRTS